MFLALPASVAGSASLSSFLTSLSSFFSEFRCHAVFAFSSFATSVRRRASLAAASDRRTSAVARWEGRATNGRGMTRHTSSAD